MSSSCDLPMVETDKKVQVSASWFTQSTEAAFNHCFSLKCADFHFHHACWLTGYNSSKMTQERRAIKRSQQKKRQKEKKKSHVYSIII